MRIASSTTAASSPDSAEQRPATLSDQTIDPRQRPRDEVVHYPPPIESTFVNHQSNFKSKRWGVDTLEACQASHDCPLNACRTRAGWFETRRWAFARCLFVPPAPRGRGRSEKCLAVRGRVAAVPHGRRKGLSTKRQDSAGQSLGIKLSGTGKGWAGTIAG
jgi:hypothetical protein